MTNHYEYLREYVSLSGLVARLCAYSGTY